MKVLFLDIDGVLNSRDFFENRKGNITIDDVPNFMANGLDKQALDNLQRIIEETNAKIVVSSTWRIGKDRTPEWFRRVFKEINGFDFPVIDKTPLLDNRCRGEEIKQWLENNKHVEQFVIIDDDLDMLKEQWKFFVKTDKKFGLTAGISDIVIDILNKEMG